MAKATDNKESANAARSGYPYYSLQKSLQIAEAVRDAGGARGEVQKSVLAHSLEADEGSAAFSQTIGAAKCFGMIQGRGTYTLTEEAKDYFFPTEESHKKVALLKMLRSPAVFDQLIRRFDGSRLPAATLLASILHREHGIGEGWSSRVASLFVSALKDAGVIDASGFIRYAATMDSVAKEGGNSSESPQHDTAFDSPPASAIAMPPIDQAIQKATVAPTVVADDVAINTWSFRLGDGVVRVQTSHELSLSLWKKLDAYIQVLKPSGDEEKAT